MTVEDVKAILAGLFLGIIALVVVSYESEPEASSTTPVVTLPVTFEEWEQVVLTPTQVFDRGY